MKKSDVIKQIVEIIKATLANDNYKETAKNVLYYLETQVKMDPPPVKKRCFCHDCECPTIRKWEKE